MAAQLPQRDGVYATMREPKPRQIAAVGVVLLVMATVFLVVVPPADQYELSLYEAYPSYFWLFIIGSMFAGALTIIADAHRSSGTAWVYGLVILLLADSLLFLLPYLRGYQSYGRADTLTHLGFARDIATESALAGNIYPPVHLLVVAVSEGTGLNQDITVMFIPVVLSFVYLGSMFYLLCQLFDDRQRILYGLAFALLPVLSSAHILARPFDQSLALIPLVLFLFLKSQQFPRVSVRTIFVISLVGFLLYHPLTALFGIVIILLHRIIRQFPRFWDPFSSPTNLLSLSVAVFLVWYTNFAGVILRFNRIYLTLFGSQIGESPLDTYTEAVEKSSPELIDVARVVTIKYGLEGVLFGLSFAFLAIWAAQVRRPAAEGFFGLSPEPDVLQSYLSTVLMMVVLFSVGGFIFLVTDLIVPHDRPFQIAKIGAVILAGQLFYSVQSGVNWDRHTEAFDTGFRVTGCIVLLLLISLSVFSLYPSPLGSSSNAQVTEMEMEGTEWLTEHGTATDEFLEFDLRYYRFYHAENGVETHPFEGGVSPQEPPPHFNYTTNRALGQSYETDQYMIINRKGRIVYPQGFTNYPEQWRYSPDDFDQLSRDNTVVRLYDNGDVQLYHVSGVDGEG